jgi:hypothetical protein
MSTAFNSILYCLIKNPTCYHNLLREIDRRDKEGLLSDLPKSSELLAMTYL